MLTAVVGLIVAGGLTALALVLTLGSRKPPNSTTPIGVPSPGTVVLFTEQNRLATVRPDGTHLSVLSYLGAFGQGLPVLSPDRRLIVAPDGTIVSIDSARPAALPTQLHLGSNQVLSATGPFTDNDRAVVVLDLGQFGAATASAGVNVVTLSTGSTVPLGTASRAAGDPLRPGVFASVPGPEVGASSGSQIEPPDRSVELRDSGSPPVQIISASAAAAAVGFDPSTQVVLQPWPDPQGDKVAITVAPSSGGPTEGVVVVDRHGALQGEVLASVGPLAGASVSWSPDGSTTAYVGFGPNGGEIATWSLGGAVSVRAIPVGEPRAALCLWSPDGSALLCPAAMGRGPALEWYLTGSTSGPIALVRAPGFPIGWIPGHFAPRGAK